MDKTKQIELIKPHRHAGRDYKSGATLELPATKADWLIGSGVAKAAAAAPTPAVAKSAKD